MKSPARQGLSGLEESVCDGKRLGTVGGDGWKVVFFFFFVVVVCVFQVFCEMKKDLFV